MSETSPLTGIKKFLEEKLPGGEVRELPLNLPERTRAETGHAMTIRVFPRYDSQNPGPLPDSLQGIVSQANFERAASSGRGVRLMDCAVTLGQDYQQRMPGIEVRKFTITEMGGAGNDRITIVSLDRSQLADMSQEQRGQLGIPDNVQLDGEYPVSYRTPASEMQGGVFYRYAARQLDGVERPDPSLGQQAADMYRQSHDWEQVRSHFSFDARTTAAIDAILALRATDTDEAALEYAQLQWLSGRDVYLTNSGGIHRGTEPDICLVYNDPSREQTELPVAATPLRKFLTSFSSFFRPKQ